MLKVQTLPMKRWGATVSYRISTKRPRHKREQTRENRRKISMLESVNAISSSVRLATEARPFTWFVTTKCIRRVLCPERGAALGEVRQSICGANKITRLKTEIYLIRHT
jgi:hypothetical protein